MIDLNDPETRKKFFLEAFSDGWYSFRSERLYTLEEEAEEAYQDFEAQLNR